MENTPFPEDNILLKKYYDLGFVFTREDHVEFCEDCKNIRKEGHVACDRHKTIPKTIRET